MGNIVRGDRCKVRALWEEFTDEAIRVFVGAALPGRVRVGKVKGETVKGLGNVLIQREFRTTVRSDAFYLVWRQAAKQSGHGVTGCLGVSPGQLSGQGESGFSVNQG